jgi:hypothetical protein
VPHKLFLFPISLVCRMVRRLSSGQGDTSRTFWGFMDSFIFLRINLGILIIFFSCPSYLVEKLRLRDQVTWMRCSGILQLSYKHEDRRFTLGMTEQEAGKSLGLVAFIVCWPRYSRSAGTENLSILRALFVE